MFISINTDIQSLQIVTYRFRVYTSDLYYFLGFSVLHVTDCKRISGKNWNHLLGIINKVV